VTQVVRCSQEKQKSHHDSHAHSRVLAIDNPVVVRNFVQGQSPPWLEDKVTACTGPLSYKVRLINGCIIHHHTDHLQHAARHLPVVQTDSDGWTMFCSHFLTPFLMDRLSRKISIENFLDVLRESDLMTPGQICCIITGEV